MTKLTDFQTYCSKEGKDHSFESLADMIGGAEKTFEQYLEGAFDQPLRDWILLIAPRALSAFTMVKLAQFEASSFFSIMGMLNQISLYLKDIKSGMTALTQPTNVQ